MFCEVSSRQSCSTQSLSFEVVALDRQCRGTSSSGSSSGPMCVWYPTAKTSVGIGWHANTENFC